MQPIYCQSKNILRQSFFTLLFVQLLNIYFFSKSVLLHFNQCLGTSYLILGAGIVVKASCCQIILYIIDFAGLLILIFKINFAISTFGNLLSLNYFILNRSHSTESVLEAISFWKKPNTTILNFFSCRKVSHILPMQNLHNTFL